MLVIVNSLGVPVAERVMLPLAVIAILLLPFCNNPLLIVVILPVVMIAVAVPKLPTLALPVTDNVPAVLKLPAVTVPITVNASVVLSYVNPESALTVPPSLNNICVLEPGATKLPLILA